MNQLPFIALRDCDPPAPGAQLKLKVGRPASVWALRGAWDRDRLLVLARLNEQDSFAQCTDDIEGSAAVVATVHDVIRETGSEGQWFSIVVEGLRYCRITKLHGYGSAMIVGD